MNRPLFAAIACTFIGVLPAPALANLVVNGGFEATPLSSGAYTTLPSIPGWTGAPTIEIQDRAAGSPYAGNNLVELDTDANSAMFQDIATVAGQHYLISFEYSARPGIAASSTGIDFLWNGALVTNIAQDGTGSRDTAWTRYTFDEVATGSLSRIGFAATGKSDSFGGYLDDVAAVTAVPEPGSLALCGAGMAILLVTKRRRRA